ncbi:MAG TPA: FliH/SctL family protein [Candidatus Sulfotelmatobacter sp.]|nr:FliH/SctL family protein [Candidatus Sulfotelmatobacter sp.]
MSTSPSRAVGSSGQKVSAIAAPFPYATISPGVPSEETSENATCQGATNTSKENQARAEGRLEGEAQSRKKFEEQLLKERSMIAAAVDQFARDRVVYFQKIEAEVVQLALSIARKIMHREAQVDPLLLAGMVRVALEKIESATEVALRIHPQNVAAWTRFFSAQASQHPQPKIVEDSSQPSDACKLESSMGTTIIGTEVQFKEIEQGFADLLAARPGGAQ